MSSRDSQITEVLKSFAFGGSTTAASADYPIKLEVATAVVDIKSAGYGCRVIMTPTDDSTVDLKGLIVTDSEGNNTHYRIDEYGSFKAIAEAVLAGNKEKSEV